MLRLVVVLKLFAGILNSRVRNESGLLILALYLRWVLVVHIKVLKITISGNITPYFKEKFEEVSEKKILITLSSNLILFSSLFSCQEIIFPRLWISFCRTARCHISGENTPQASSLLSQNPDMQSWRF
jgi:hypothetical protein